MVCIATFNGRHNMVKSAVLLLLHQYPGKLSLADITRYTEGNYHSLAVLLGRWHNWGYVTQYYSKKRGMFLYGESSRGERFIFDRLPRPLYYQLRERLHKIHAKIERENRRNRATREKQFDAILKKYGIDT